MKRPITICEQYPEHWEYDGKPIMLIGGSKEDNLFQIPDLIEHLDILRSSGGNYIRCTMSSRDPGDIEPFKKIDGRYDLNEFSEEYWKRFSNFLKFTYKFEIIVQIELWDRFDFTGKPWQKNAFNPKNNCNYTDSESLLKEVIDTHPGHNENRFFFTIPGLDNNETVLKYQKAFVDKLLSYSLPYPHLLYCMDNETNGTAEWGAYWSGYIKERASAKGRTVHTTEMWDPWEMSDERHARTFDHPETYSFCDISQNNHMCGIKHWSGIEYVKERIKSRVRPINNVKIYGSGTYETIQDGIERFWRGIFGKCASVGFHRNDSGLGLTPLAQKHILSARKLLNEIDIFGCKPHNDLIIKSKENEAYCMANPGKEIVVYFTLTYGGDILLDTSGLDGDLIVKWLDINNARSGDVRTYKKTDQLRLAMSNRGEQIAIIMPDR